MRLLRLRVLKITVASVIAALIALYLALVATTAYSARQTAKLLSSLETVHVGDSGASFLSKLRGCAIERTGSAYTCEKYTLPLVFEWGSTLLWKLPRDWSFTISEYLWRIGLRPSDVFVTAVIDHDLVQKIHVRVILVGRYESLGTMWDLSERVPEYEGVASLSDDERRTHMHWFHITSVPGGEGFR